MSLPSGFLDELRARVSLTSVVGRKVQWDQRKSNQGKGDMWAPCPFHQEKTASFHVLDREGYYYCFGCHAKGDAITFLKDTENLSFMEAVQELARQAGMTLPERDPGLQKQIDARSVLADVMEKAVRYFRMMIKTQAGREASLYLDGRGLSEGTQNRFDVGYASDNRQGLLKALTEQGVREEQLIECGLCIAPDNGGAPYDRFRNRVMFPIRDARGHCIAFGGRAMDQNARAKYLNSPETLLFDKGRSLYNIGSARSALGKSHPLIVSEGYMDVIALSQAGFETAVAPLGTAITENQLQMMWRLHPEPVVALDGDAAGLRAAYRLIDIALPHIDASRALRFALMPEGQDPDDVIQKGGPEAFQTLLENAIPMVDLMWRQATEGQNFDSPERKSALEHALQNQTRLIKDAGLRRNYETALRDKRWDFFRAQTSPRYLTSQKGGGRRNSAPVTQVTKASRLAARDGFSADHLKESVIIAALINCPKALEGMIDELQGFEFFTSEYGEIVRVLCQYLPQSREDAEARVSDAMGKRVLEMLWSENHVHIAPCMKQPQNVEMTIMTVQAEVQKLAIQRGLAAELEEVSRGSEQDIDDTSVWRITRAVEAKNTTLAPTSEDKAAYDMADNGARINRSEKDGWEKLLSEISFSKEKK